MENFNKKQGVVTISTPFGARRRVDVGKQLARLNAKIDRTAGDLSLLRALRHALLREVGRRSKSRNEGGDGYGEN